MRRQDWRRRTKSGFTIWRGPWFFRWPRVRKLRIRRHRSLWSQMSRRIWLGISTNALLRKSHRSFLSWTILEVKKTTTIKGINLIKGIIIDKTQSMIKHSLKVKSWRLRSHRLPITCDSTNEPSIPHVCWSYWTKIFLQVVSASRRREICPKSQLTNSDRKSSTSPRTPKWSNYFWHCRETPRVPTMSPLSSPKAILSAKCGRIRTRHSSWSPI